MKIKKIGKSMAAIILGAAMCLSTFAFIGCGSEENPGGEGPGNGPDIGFEDPSKAVVTVTTDKDELRAGSNDTITISVSITELSNKSYELSLDGNGASYVELKDNVLSLKPGIAPQTQQTVKIVATSTVSNTVKGFKSINIIPQVFVGVVDDLTTEMFTALGNASITVSGEVKDIGKDLTGANPRFDFENVYDYTVKMEDGAWYGSWNRKGSKDLDIHNYRRSENVYESTGLHTFDEVYINKDNEVAHKAVTDYLSVPAFWEEQHYWNHLKDLGNDIENQWLHDETNDVYVYQFDNNSIEDLYFRTYLAFSLTPMLKESDTLEAIALTVEDGVITKMSASTQIIYYGGEQEGSAKGATAMSYTVLTCDFTDVGTTKVPDPEKFEAPRHADALEKALASMGNATNYTFRAVETTSSAPSYDPDDYEEYAVSSYSKRARATSSTGTVGLVGQVTEDAVLLARTGKYEYGMDDNLYWTEYSGYIQLDQDTYDYFEYSADLRAYQGKKQYRGNLFDSMPKFEFSANVFEYAGMSDVKVGDNWVELYNFVLREPAITRDVAMQVSSHSYAKDAQGSTHGTLKITVTTDGRLVSTQFPYSLVAGTYLGVVETTYSNIGNTTIPEGTFDEYAPRVLRSSWSQYKVKYYHPDHTTQSGYGDIDAETLFGQIFGDEAKNLPSPLAFYYAFGDNMTECFFEWEDIDNTATGGTIEYQDYISFNLSVEEYDENYMVSKAIYDSVMDKLTAELAKYGFTKSLANCGEKWGNRYTTYVNGTIMIKIENNKTKNFFAEILPVGMWTLSD